MKRIFKFIKANSNIISRTKHNELKGTTTAGRKSIPTLSSQKELLELNEICETIRRKPCSFHPTKVTIMETDKDNNLDALEAFFESKQQEILKIQTVNFHYIDSYMDIDNISTTPECIATYH